MPAFLAILHPLDERQTIRIVSVKFSRNLGSRDGLKRLTRWGGRLCAFLMLWTVDLLTF